LKIFEEYVARISEGGLDTVYDYFTEDFFSHVVPRVTPDIVGIDIRPWERLFWEDSKKAFPDRKFTLNLPMASGDIVVSNWTLTGTHTGGNYFDLPPSGKKVEINGTAIVRFKDGKLIEHWGEPHCMNGIGLYARPE